jgi:hypothetical protein
MKRLLPALLIVVLAGCTAQTNSSSVDRFKDPEQRAVAQKIEDLETAGRRGKAGDICAKILSRSLVSQLDSAGTDCQTEMEKAIADANDYALEVRNVTINGNEATAEVQQGTDGPTETMHFTREGGDWRATALSEG